MIIIEKPELQKDGKEVLLSTRFQVEGEHNILWYRFSSKFEDYLVTESLDASLVGLLFLGLKTGNDIKLNGPVSARLLYTINHYLIKALCLANNEFKEIKIIADSLNHEDMNLGSTAGTGFSCGVDSFATYFSHSGEHSPFDIKYLTFFNVGSHGDFGGEKARKVYQKRLRSVNTFAEKAGKKVISIDSNLSEILKLNFQKTNTYRSASCILNLQKLFKNYYYASSFPLDQFNLNSVDTSYYDLLNLSMLSTESINFFSSDIYWTRIDKTSFISQFPETYDFLDVCTNLRDEFNSKNCSTCDKCMRTALTLELLGKLHLYKNVFDLDIYQNNKNRYIGKVLGTKKENIFNKDLLRLLLKKRKISLIHYGYYSSYKYKKLKKRIRKVIKKNPNKD
ncbi:hypothetical protein SAMN04488034_10414 [Salinimicrobium catena]|uniref:Uncharacterized protein n=1 Tax=Salinimicrobium catena TaxID=390640 RepID=A0A1H5NAF2_9FLAO|nr:hypothetical protein [Salinimicrobium catena]SDL41093.1 hypothetical protein SAMN04488140_10414 [Salinimicrobium catena]SEE98543.1 hypothetical protein SAMN04488034_10414 [Salinimicrobium catena]